MQIIDQLALDFASTKVCRDCGLPKERTDFAYASRNYDRRSSYCRACSNKRMRLHNLKPEVKAHKHLQHKLKTYGLTPEYYQELLDKQQGVCAICKQLPLSGKGWQVDHDHRTGAIRGLLCHECNTGIGALRDDVDILRQAIEYLSKSSTDV